MIEAPIQADTLEAFYTALVAAQQAAHGDDYTAHHDAIRRMAAKGCASYAELGVCQGATLACALLAGFRHVVGVDTALHRFAPYAGLFRAWALARDVALDVREQDSREPLGMAAVDVLFLDTKHEHKQLQSELRTHGAKVSRYILVHDTTLRPEIVPGLQEWAQRGRWTVAQVEPRNVGFMLLKRRG